jgi:hypothetical protein
MKSDLTRDFRFAGMRGHTSLAAESGALAWIQS